MSLSEAFCFWDLVSILTELSIAEMKTKQKPKFSKWAIGSGNETILTSLFFLLFYISQLFYLFFWPFLLLCLGSCAQCSSEHSVLYTVPWKLAPHPLQMSSLNWQLSYMSTSYTVLPNEQPLSDVVCGRNSGSHFMSMKQVAWSFLILSWIFVHGLNNCKSMDKLAQIASGLAI